MFKPSHPGRRMPEAAAGQALIPWAVNVEHRWAVPYAMLWIEARERGGFALPSGDRERLSAFRSGLAEGGLVVHYEPRTLQGWWLVPRRPGIDGDLIREPGVVGAARRRLVAGRGLGRTPLTAHLASVLRTCGRVGDLLAIRRAPIAGSWRTYPGAEPRPARRRFRRAVWWTSLEYTIHWEAGPFLDADGRVYFDTTPRPGSAEYRFAVREGFIDG